LPNSGDHVCLTVNPTGAAVNHRTGTTTIKSLQRDSAGEEPLVLSGGRLDISDSETSDVDDLTQSGGTIGGTATVSVGNLTWTDGAQDTPDAPFSQPGPGATVVSGQLTIDRPDANQDPNAYNPPKNLNRLLRVETGATATLKGNNGANSLGYLNLQGLSGKLEQAGALEIRQDQDIFGAARGVVNTGTITKTAGTGRRSWGHRRTSTTR